MESPSSNDPAGQLRRLSPEQLVKAGEESLRQRLAEQAVYAHWKHGPLTVENLERFLLDPECVRYPTRLAYEFGEMAAHQFAQPDFDYRDPEKNGRVLYLRPMLRDQPELAVLAVAYMVPVINYGEVVDDELCRRFGATLLGLTEEEFYGKICALADLTGAEARYPGTPGGAQGPG